MRKIYKLKFLSYIAGERVYHREDIDRQSGVAVTQYSIVRFWRRCISQTFVLAYCSPIENFTSDGRRED